MFRQWGVRLAWSLLRVRWLIVLALLLSCKDPAHHVEVTPGPGADTAAVVDDGVLYNGIELPSQWPPRRDYASDIRCGMSPYYLKMKPDVIRVDVGRQLFVDDFLVRETTMRRRWHRPTYHAQNPVVKPDREWEAKAGGGGFAAPFSDGVWFDEADGLFKMWYMAGDDATCYAESADGVTWVKPDLGDGTNVVRKGSLRDASTVWLDKQEASAVRRYKMFEVAGGVGNWSYVFLTSADGKRWRDEGAGSKRVADRSTVFKNPFRNVWVWSMRHNVRLRRGDPYTIRARDYAESANPDNGNRAAEASLRSFWFGSWPDELTHPDYDNDDGSPGIYNLDAMPYESVMLGLFTVWQGPENDICAAEGVIKRNQVMVGYSRDGFSWHRGDMTPFLPVAGGAAAWNSGNVQSAVGSPIVVGDNLYFYVSGRRLSSRGIEETSTGLATLRRDGFASMCAEGDGTLITEPVTFDGSHLFVNALARRLVVEVLDRDGRLVDGFAAADCEALVDVDSTRLEIRWCGGASIGKLAGREVRLRFHVADGDLYSFWLSPWPSGESRGYTAGGGPGLSPTGVDVPM